MLHCSKRYWSRFLRDQQLLWLLYFYRTFDQESDEHCYNGNANASEKYVIECYCIREERANYRAPRRLNNKW